MSKIDLGVLVFKEWFDAARGLSGLEFKKLFLAMCDYQLYGKEPPTFTPKAEPLARVIFPCIERRLTGAAYAKKGAESFKCDEDGLAEGDPDRVFSSTLEAKEEKRKEKNNIALSLTGAHTGAHASTGERESGRRSYNTESGHGRRNSNTESESELSKKKQREKYWSDFFDAAVAHALGPDA